MADRRDEWQQIEREAREQVRADIAAVESRPLEFGEFIAWTECRFGRTDGLSVVHRVASATVASYGAQRTICGDVIPETIRRLTLNPNLVRALGRCKYCEADYLKQQNGAAA